MNRTLIIGLVLISVGSVDLDAQEPMDLVNLVQRGDTYLTPETLVPYSGPAFSVFPSDSNRIREQGTLGGGTWEGLYESFYFNGQVDSKIEYRGGEFDGSFERYYFDGKLLAKGSYSMGVRCGEWIDEGGQPTQMTYPPCSSN
ncbi:MAG: hypothetical protein ABGY10_08415 [bacterium]|jgi:hypothetical protein|nr:hypothetical protein [Gemmatimonadota bacterium]HIL89329.1 hypothetical protein [Gemmatimonadota bacterium]